MPKVFLSCFVFLLLVAAAGAQEQQPPPVEEKKAEEAKPDAPKVEIAAPVDPNSYLIGTADVIGIRVWREQELSGAHAVRPDGRITMPLVGDIVVGNQTPEQVKASVVKALSDIIKEPQVSISILQVNSKRYFITGEVNRTGPFPLITPITIMEALSFAGGFKEFANTKKIIIWRNGKQIKFNYKDVLAGKNLEQNIHLEPGDHLVVP